MEYSSNNNDDAIVRADEQRPNVAYSNICVLVVFRNKFGVNPNSDVFLGEFDSNLDAESNVDDDMLLLLGLSELLSVSNFVCLINAFISKAPNLFRIFGVVANRKGSKPSLYPPSSLVK